VSIEAWVSSPSEINRSTRPRSGVSGGSEVFRKSSVGPVIRSIAESKLFGVGNKLSPWSESKGKRFFDCACVLALLPVLIPLCLAIAATVRLTSSGPVLFLQERTGRHGRNFTILKFRTMLHTSSFAHRPVTTTANQRFTPIGPFLRRWKLDELPQLLNVVAGDMSLIGPRPKMPEHGLARLSCRPGITGAATIAFAHEEAGLSSVPTYHLESFYHAVILPTKLELDAQYMAHATFFSDLQLIAKSVLRRWDDSVMDGLVQEWCAQRNEDSSHISSRGTNGAAYVGKHPQLDRPASPGEVRAY